MLLFRPLRRTCEQLSRCRSLLTIFALAVSPASLWAAGRTCGTDPNETCGLNGVLHLLYIAAGVMGVLFLIVLALVVRYYIRIKRTTDSQEIDAE